MTTDKYNINDGVFMEIRVDDFVPGSDYWLSFHIWDEQTIALPYAEYGRGYINLIRFFRQSNGADSGSAAVENYLMTDTLFDRQLSGPAFPTYVDDDGKQIFTFEVKFDSTKECYVIKCNDVVVSEENNPKITEELKKYDANGNFYVGVSMHTTATDATAALTVTKFGESAATATVPTGSDSKQAENNPYAADWELSDPDTVPENTPALLWDAAGTSFAGDPTGTNLTFDPLGNGGYKLTTSGGETVTLTWTIKKELAYDGYDFPVFVMLSKNLNCNTGHLRYCAGAVTGFSDADTTVWQMFHKGTRWFTDANGDLYSMIVVDLTDEMIGRIHALRIDFNQPEANVTWDIMYMGMFRSIDEADAYTATRYADTLTPYEFGDNDTESETDTDTETEGIDTVTDTETEAATENNTQAPTETTTDEGGCGAVVGMSAAAVLLSAAAAAVVLKKKD